MTTSKSPKARHMRLLSKGFFPPEMPSCFYSESFGVNRDAALKAFEGIPAKKNGAPDFYSFKGERAAFNFPRFGREDRRHSYINPISYFYLSKVLAEKYVPIRKLNRRSKISIAPAIFDWAGERALIRPAFDARDSQRATLNAGYELLAEADITAFFHSVYTHVIAWAIHGKAVAKKNKHDMGLHGNLIDLLVRNAQDGQTIGLPVGPDTSRLIAEIIGTSIDKAIQTHLRGKRKWGTRQRSGMRFVDDFTFGCASREEAELVISAIRRCVNEHELDLNNSKTKIVPTGPFFITAWKEHVRSLLPQNDASKNRILQYFYGIETATRAHPEANVQKFALQNARRLFLETSEWPLIEDFLLSSYRQNPSVISVVAEILILRHIAKKDVAIERIGAFVAARLSTLTQLQKNGEIYWLLFLCISLRAPLRASAISGLFEVEDGAIALLITDAHRLGIIQGSINRAIWNSSLTVDGLRSAMWLYAYEGTLKGLNGSSSKSHVSSDPYFGPLLTRNIEFYRSGSFHMSRSALLASLRLERLRRQIQQAAVEDDLAESVSDFDEEDFETTDGYDDNESELY